ncbi:MAG: DUF2809 domain-containing protein [Pseudomonadota bacterium]
MTAPTRTPYALVSGALFIVLVLIALFASGGLRTHGGDLVVVVWMAATLRMLTLWNVALCGAIVLAIAFAVEAGQAIGLTARLGLPDNAATRLTLGHSFDPLDLIMYVCGAAAAVALDTAYLKGRSS